MANKLNNVYYRAVVIDINETDILYFFGNKNDYNLKKVVVNNFYYYIIKCNPLTVLSDDIEIEVDDENNIIEYSLTLMPFIKDNKFKCIFLSSSEKLLRILSDRLDKKFYKVDIGKICDNNYISIKKRYLSITRLSAKINYEGSNKVRNIILFGDDIIESTTIDLILGSDKDYKDTPFTKKHNDNYIPRIEPSSCRVLYDNGSIRIAVNLDSFGNFSCILKGESCYEALHTLYSILFDDIECMHEKTMYNPLKRSRLALKSIE